MFNSVSLGVCGYDCSSNNVVVGVDSKLKPSCFFFIILCVCVFFPWSLPKYDNKIDPSFAQPLLWISNITVSVVKFEFSFRLKTVLLWQSLSISAVSRKLNLQVLRLTCVLSLEMTLPLCFCCNQSPVNDPGMSTQLFDVASITDLLAHTNMREPQSACSAESQLCTNTLTSASVRSAGGKSMFF